MPHTSLAPQACQGSITLAPGSLDEQVLSWEGLSEVTPSHLSPVSPVIPRFWLCPLEITQQMICTEWLTPESARFGAKKQKDISNLGRAICSSRGKSFPFPPFLPRSTSPGDSCHLC